ncbi:MAG: hypothetical protein OEY00_09170 [Gammaproteobacteria bacterium]|nr:hypothetical protein [Gammaproteobacteria bacterium]
MRLLFLLALFAVLVNAQAKETREEALERWFNSDSFDLPDVDSTAHVNEGDLEFLASAPKPGIHHHHNSITILPTSLHDGWIKLEQCHTNLDKVFAAQIMFNKDKVRDIQITEYKNISKAWVEGSSVQMQQIKANAKLCLKARSRALIDDDNGKYHLRSGPYMRKFLDGYYPIRLSMDIKYQDTGLKLVSVSPEQQKGFKVWKKPGNFGFDAIFEGRLTTEFGFKVGPIRLSSSKTH